MKTALLAILVIFVVVVTLIPFSPSSVPKNDREKIIDLISPGVKCTIVLLKNERQLDANQFRVDLTQEDLPALKDIFARSTLQGWWSLILAARGMSHALIFEDKAGQHNVLWLGFETHKARLNEGTEFEMPPLWLWKLKNFVLSTGMPMNAKLLDRNTLNPSAPNPTGK